MGGFISSQNTSMPLSPQDIKLCIPLKKKFQQNFLFCQPTYTCMIAFHVCVFYRGLSLWQRIKGVTGDEFDSDTDFEENKMTSYAYTDDVVEQQNGNTEF